eukprot:767633-Hanusia_phi.AAC.3
MSQNPSTPPLPPSLRTNGGRQSLEIHPTPFTLPPPLARLTCTPTGDTPLFFTHPKVRVEGPWCGGNEGYDFRCKGG